MSESVVNRTQFMMSDVIKADLLIADPVNHASSMPLTGCCRNAYRLCIDRSNPLVEVGISTHLAALTRRRGTPPPMLAKLGSPGAPNTKLSAATTSSSEYTDWALASTIEAREPAKPAVLFALE